MTDKVFEYMPIDEARRRAEAFSAGSGIPTSELVASRLVNLPIPVWPSSWPEGCRRWKGASVDILRSPLAWLDDSLASRLVIDGDVETDDEWAIRVCLSLEWRGWLDEETGRLADVMFNHDIDMKDEQVRQRAARWLAGGRDPQFDSVSLGEPHENERHEFVLPLVQAIIEQNEPQVLAWDLEDFVGAFEDFSNDPAVDDPLGLLSLMVSDARSCFLDDDDQKFWMGLQRKVRTHPRVVVNEAAEWLRRRLDQLQTAV